MKKVLLWLDDIRNPFYSSWVSSYVPKDNYDTIVWVKSYDEFVSWIIENGLPYHVSFDHDLADIHYDPLTWTEGFVYHEKTGYDAAKWLVDYCIDNTLSMPHYTVHSANPVGSENIKRYLNNSKRFF